MAAAAGAGVAVIVAIAATGFWGAGTSTHDVRPLGSIGSDGWVSGPGFRIRLHPDWFRIDQAAYPGQVVIGYTVHGSLVDISRAPAGAALASFRAFPQQYKLRQVSSRPVVIGGVRDSASAARTRPGRSSPSRSCGTARTGMSWDSPRLRTTGWPRKATLGAMLRTWRWDAPG